LASDSRAFHSFVVASSAEELNNVLAPVILSPALFFGTPSMFDSLEVKVLFTT